MSDQPIRVGPTAERCDECGAPSDGYGAFIHYAECSKAPVGKRRKAVPTLVRVEDLPDDLRESLGLAVRPAPTEEAND